MRCKICGGNTEAVFSAVIRNTHKGIFSRCLYCGFVCIEDPFWLKTEKCLSVSDSDTGLVTRNIYLSKITFILIKLFYNHAENLLDYGGGNGLFVKFMRDYGVNFQWYDPYTHNIYANGCEYDIQRLLPMDLVTSFETFEHFLEPQTNVEELFKISHNIFFSTELIPEKFPGPGDWKYYDLNNGQHVSFYTYKALAYMAKKNGLNFYSDGKSLHLFAENDFLWGQKGYKTFINIAKIYNRLAA